MSRLIFLFADYHHKENSLSNYSSLVMELLFEETPKRFQEYITAIVDSQVDLVIGSSFHQQTKK